MRTLLVALLAAGCGGSTFDYAGQDVYKHMPLDGQRAWSYVQEGVTTQLRIEKAAATTTSGDMVVSTLDFYSVDPETNAADLMFSMDVSSDSVYGIVVHGWTDAAGNREDFDPTLRMADPQMNEGDTVDTSTGGANWTAAYVGVEGCANHWVTETWDCLHVSLDDGGAGYPFAGDWWLAATWGPSWFQGMDDANPWVLTKGEWDPEAEE